MGLRLLRGRVMIRPIEPDKTHGGIIIPDPQKRTNANTLGRGVVIDMGPPALTPLRWDTEYEEWRGGVEIPPDFKIGDEVLHIGQHVSRDSWNNGERVRYCSQEEVCAVIQRAGMYVNHFTGRGVSE